MFLNRGYPVYCADLTRVGWITGLLPSALSLEYFKGELVPADTLKVSCTTYRVNSTSRVQDASRVALYFSIVGRAEIIQEEWSLIDTHMVFF